VTKVSVVIVNYNSGEFLKGCIKNVRCSDCSLEIIVVDNASTDGSADFLRDFSSNDVSVQVIRNEENSGFSAGVNRGVRYSNSENVLLLNPDCLVFPHTIGLLSDALNTDASAGIVGGLVFNFDGSEQRGCRRREPTLVRSLGKVIRRHTFAAELNQVDMTDEPLPEKRISVDSVSGSFLMIRRGIFADIGGMDEGFFLHFEDFDLCRRVRDIGWNVVFVPDISIFHYGGGSSEYLDHRVSREKHRSMRRYQRKHHGHNSWLRGLVFLVVWSHFILQRTKWMFIQRSKIPEERQWVPADWAGFPWMNISIDSKTGNGLLVLGAIDEPIRDIIQFGATIGWSIYIRREQKNAQRRADVHLLHPEYFDKVPVRDAPEINALLIAPSFSCRETVDRMVEKFRVRRIALIQLVSSSDRTNRDALSKAPEVKEVQAMLPDSLMGDEFLDGEIKLFSLPLSKPTTNFDTGEGRRGKDIEDCFSWLSK
jgi:hypothetical protein